MKTRGCRFAGESAWTRRAVMRTSGLTAAGLVLPLGRLAAEADTRIPIAVQLYSVRGDCAKDVDAALESLSETSPNDTWV